MTKCERCTNEVDVTPISHIPFQGGWISLAAQMMICPICITEITSSTFDAITKHRTSYNKVITAPATPINPMKGRNYGIEMGLLTTFEKHGEDYTRNYGHRVYGADEEAAAFVQFYVDYLVAHQADHDLEFEAYAMRKVGSWRTGQRAVQYCADHDQEFVTPFCPRCPQVETPNTKLVLPNAPDAGCMSCQGDKPADQLFCDVCIENLPL